MPLFATIDLAVVSLGSAVTLGIAIAGFVLVATLIVFMAITNAMKDGAGKRKPDGWRRPGGWLCVCYCMMLVVVHFAAGFILGVNRAGTEEIIAWNTSISLVFVLAVLISTYRGSLLRAMRFKLPSLAHALIFLTLSVPILILAIRELQLLELWFDVSGDLMKMESRITRQPLIWGIVFLGVLPGLAEEMFFRGFIGRGLVARHGIVIGVLISSLLFALIHVHPIMMINAFLLGVVFHIVYLATGTLVIPILLHAAHNSLVFAYGKELLPNLINITPTALNDQSIPVAVWLPALLFLITAITFIVLTRKPHGWALPWTTGFDDLDRTQPHDQVESQTRRSISRGRVVVCLLVLVTCGVGFGMGVKANVPDRITSLMLNVMSPSRGDNGLDIYWQIAQSDLETRQQLFSRFTERPELMKGRMDGRSRLLQALVGTDPRMREYIARTYVLPNRNSDWGAAAASALAKHLVIHVDDPGLALNDQKPDTYVDAKHSRPIVTWEKSRWYPHAKPPATDLTWTPRTGKDVVRAIHWGVHFEEFVKAIPPAAALTESQVKPMAEGILNRLGKHTSSIPNHPWVSTVAELLDRALLIFNRLPSEEASDVERQLIDHVRNGFRSNHAGGNTVMLTLYQRWRPEQFRAHRDEFLDLLGNVTTNRVGFRHAEPFLIVLGAFPESEQLAIIDRFEGLLGRHSGMPAELIKVRLSPQWANRIMAENMTSSHVETATFHHPECRSVRYLLELLKYPTCVGSGRDAVLRELRAYSGLEFEENVWDAVAKLHEAGIAAEHFYQPAKRYETK